jgi:hypothetical protein
LAADGKARLKLLEREMKELRRANEILRKASAYFAMAELGSAPPSRRYGLRACGREIMMMSFIDAHRKDLGIPLDLGNQH